MALVVDASEVRFLSVTQISKETGLPWSWASAHAPLMPGLTLTPTGQYRVPRVGLRKFLLKHDPSTCSACEHTNAEAATSASSAR